MQPLRQTYNCTFFNLSPLHLKKTRTESALFIGGIKDPKMSIKVEESLPTDGSINIFFCKMILLWHLNVQQVVPYLYQCEIYWISNYLIKIDRIVEIKLVCQQNKHKILDLTDAHTLFLGFFKKTSNSFLTYAIMNNKNSKKSSNHED